MANSLLSHNIKNNISWPERLLSAALNDFDNQSFTSSWTPAVDIKEEENRYIVKADLPGVQNKDIEITMVDNTLTIKGEKKLEKEKEEKGYHRVERSYGSFTRSFTFPNLADSDGIKATGKDGVLEIVIPKRSSALPKKIAVE